MKLISEEDTLEKLDKSANTELEGEDGLDSIVNNIEPKKDNSAIDNIDNIDNLDNKQELKDDYNPKSNVINDPSNRSGYTLKNVADQLDGIVNNWFEFAINMKPDSKEKFLALGERVSEISDILKKEFSNV